MNHSLLPKVNKLYPVLKLKELKHRFIYTRHNHDMKVALERYRQSVDKKPSYIINKEMDLCKKFWGCYPLHYIRYELYRKDKQLSDEELIDYIPEYFFYRLFLRFYDSGKHSNLLSEKCITEQLFRSLGINQPATIAKLVNGTIFSSNMDTLNYDGLTGILRTNNFNKIFFKPVDGEGGAGIFSFRKTPDGQYISRENILFNEEFIKSISRQNNYIIQAGIIQHPEFIKIYPHSVNTLRITTRQVNGTVEIPCAVIRMGRGGCEVDNSCQGGLFTEIDIESGALMSKAYTQSYETFQLHPDTGFVFKGYKIPCWDEVKEFVRASARKLHYFTYLGWDIAYTEEGPIAIEANLFFGLDIYQLAMGGIRKQFGIEDPSFYWKALKKST